MIKNLMIISTLLSNFAYANDRKYYTGENIEVCSPPDEIIHRQEVSGSPYFLNYGVENSRIYLTIVIWESDIPELEINPYTYFNTDNFCVRGNVTSYRNKSQITVRNQDQLFISKN